MLMSLLAKYPKNMLNKNAGMLANILNKNAGMLANMLNKNAGKYAKD